MRIELMLPISNSFEYDYSGCTIHYGRGVVERLTETLDRHGFQSALLVCGRHVGANDNLMGPIIRGSGDRIVGVFSETTPTKSVETVYDGIEVMNRHEPDVLIGVGGGSSLDIARQMSSFHADGRPMSEFQNAARSGSLQPPRLDNKPIPVIIIPTTFAGADLSGGGSIEVLSAVKSPTGHPVRTRAWNMPRDIFYDPDLYETTPMDALGGSVMNGFNKGIESMYANNSTPVTDATAIHGVKLLRDSLPKLVAKIPGAMERAVIGIILVQFERQTSVIHAFGHGFARRYPVQQGVVHAIVTPHVLRYLFKTVNASRILLADAFRVDSRSLSDEEIAEKIIDEVISIRDVFDLPSRLQDIEYVEKDHLEEISAYILKDKSMPQAPQDLNPSESDIIKVLETAW